MVTTPQSRRLGCSLFCLIRECVYNSVSIMPFDLFSPDCLSIKLNLRVEENYLKMSQVAAELLVCELRNLLTIKPKAVVVLSAGGTPEMLYSLLVRKYKDSLDWRRVVLFQMDDYWEMSVQNPKSMAYYLLDKIVYPLNIGTHYLLNVFTAKSTKLVESYTEFLDEFEEKIIAEGGIDIIVHGIGSNGHLGFNEPGSSFDSKARIVTLEKSTILENSRFFNSITEVPTQAVTLGLNTLSKARKIFLLASGKNKKSAVRGCILGPVTKSLPASILRISSSTIFIVDKEAWF